MFSPSRGEWVFLAFILFYSFVPAFGGLLRIVDLMAGPTIIPENSRALASPFPVVLHILGSLVFCLGGAFQFLPSIRRMNISLHRWLGKIVSAAGLLSGVTGLWMTLTFEFPPELQGILLYWVRIVVSLAMFLFIFRAVASVLSGNIFVHRSSMIRAYAIGQGASSQAILGISWMILFGTELTGLSRDIVMVSAWCINQLFAEVFIARTNSLTLKSRYNEFTA